jgi:hypothetical protein
MLWTNCFTELSLYENSFVLGDEGVYPTENMPTMLVNTTLFRA